MNFLLHHLVSWLLLGPVFGFAAADIAISGVGNEADTTDSDDAAVSGGNRDATDGLATGGEADERQSADGPEPANNDARTLPKNIQSTLKALAEQHPELKKDLDELRKGYFDSRGHREFFKNPAEARQAKAALDLVGGHEGIANLQSQVAAIEMVDGALEAGDPQVLDDMFADFGEGMKKLAGPYLERLEKMDPQAVSGLVQPYLYRMLESSEMGQRLSEAYAAIGANKPDEAKTLLSNIYRWLEAQKQQAGQKRSEDPEKAKLAAERQKFENEKESSFRKDIGRQTVAHQGSEIRRALNADPRFRKLSKDAQADVVEGANAEVNRRLKADTDYQSQMKANLASRRRDAAQIIAYVNSVVSEVAEKAAPFIMTRRYGSAPVTRKPTTDASGAKTENAGQKNPAQSTPIRLTAKPKTSDIVKDRNWDLRWMKNQAVMATGPHKGKLVTWLS